MPTSIIDRAFFKPSPSFSAVWGLASSAVRRTRLPPSAVVQFQLSDLLRTGLRVLKGS